MTQILIVDDEPQIRNMYHDFLREDYPNIIQAINGKEAMEKLANFKVDLVITDMLMPEQDGLNTILEIKHMYPHIKIIAISGKPESLTKANFFGVDKYLNKPLDPLKLAAAINDLGF